MGFKNFKALLEPTLGSDHELINIPDSPAGNLIALSELPGIKTELEAIKSTWAADEEIKNTWNCVYICALIESLELAISNNENLEFLNEN